MKKIKKVVHMFSPLSVVMASGGTKEFERPASLKSRQVRVSRERAV